MIIKESLDNTGFARISNALTAAERDQLIDNYPNERLYRSVIDMKRYRFGEGQYKYFSTFKAALCQNLEPA